MLIFEMSNEGVFRMTEKALEMLRLLEKNAAYSNELLADLLNISVAEVKAIRNELEDQAVILGYQTLIDWTKVLNTELVTAMIEVKVTPTRGKGFDQVAERIYRFKEVKARNFYVRAFIREYAQAVEGVKFVLITFFGYCAIESTAGLWASSYLVEYLSLIHI